MLSTGNASSKLKFTEIKWAADDGRCNKYMDPTRAFHAGLLAILASGLAQHQLPPKVALSLVDEDNKEVPDELALYRSGGKPVEPQELIGNTVIFENCWVKAISYKDKNGFNIRKHGVPRKFRLKAEFMVGGHVVATACSDLFIVKSRAKNGRPSRESAHGTGCFAGVDGLHASAGEQQPGKSPDNELPGQYFNVDVMSPTSWTTMDAQQLQATDRAVCFHRIADLSQTIHAGLSHVDAGLSQFEAYLRQIDDSGEEIHVQKKQCIGYVSDDDTNKYLIDNDSLFAQAEADVCCPVPSR